jgi:hypothetical protein
LTGYDFSESCEHSFKFQGDGGICIESSVCIFWYNYSFTVTAINRSIMKQLQTRCKTQSSPEINILQEAIKYILKIHADKLKNSGL